MGELDPKGLEAAEDAYEIAAIDADVSNCSPWCLERAIRAYLEAGAEKRPRNVVSADNARRDAATLHEAADALREGE